MSKNTWSKDRPQKPNRDPMLDDLVELLTADKRSTFAKANVSGLSPSTLKNWENGKVNRPQSVSMQMAYRMLGYELKPVPVGNVVPMRRRA
jgi:transcriptional regulator with XRE-family HTH domain